MKISEIKIIQTDMKKNQKPDQKVIVQVKIQFYLNQMKIINKSENLILLEKYISKIDL